MGWMGCSFCPFASVALHARDFQKDEKFPTTTGFTVQSHTQCRQTGCVEGISDVAVTMSRLWSSLWSFKIAVLLQSTCSWIPCLYQMYSLCSRIMGSYGGPTDKALREGSAAGHAAIHINWLLTRCVCRNWKSLGIETFPNCSKSQYL